MFNPNRVGVFMPSIDLDLPTVMHKPGWSSLGDAVQISFGTDALYLTVDAARKLAEDILAALPAVSA